MTLQIRQYAPAFPQSLVVSGLISVPNAVSQGHALGACCSLETPSGVRSVTKIEQGELIRTACGDWQKVAARRTRRAGARAMVRLPASDVTGPEPFCVDREAHVMICHPLAELHFTESAVLVRASDLVACGFASDVTVDGPLHEIELERRGIAACGRSGVVLPGVSDSLAGEDEMGLMVLYADETRLLMHLLA